MIEIFYLKPNGKQTSVHYDVCVVPSDDAFGPHVTLTPVAEELTEPYKIIIPWSLFRECGVTLNP